MRFSASTKNSSRSGACSMTYFRCDVCDGVMDEYEATVSMREPHPELDGCPTEWVTEMRCIYSGAEEIWLTEIGSAAHDDESTESGRKGDRERITYGNGNCKSGKRATA